MYAVKYTYYSLYNIPAYPTRLTFFLISLLTCLEMLVVVGCRAGSWVLYLSALHGPGCSVETACYLTLVVVTLCYPYLEITINIQCKARVSTNNNMGKVKKMAGEDPEF